MFNKTLVLSAFAMFAASAWAGAIVSDGGFETASGSCSGITGAVGDGWTVTAGTIAICDTATLSGTVPHSGNNLAYLDWSNTVNTLQQTLTTVAGQNYAISFWLADSGPDPVTVMFGGQTLFSGSAPTGGVGTS